MPSFGVQTYNRQDTCVHKINLEKEKILLLNLKLGQVGYPVSSWWPTSSDLPTLGL